jgi:hypothetical protein
MNRHPSLCISPAERVRHVSICCAYVHMSTAPPPECCSEVGRANVLSPISA